VVACLAEDVAIDDDVRRAIALFRFGVLGPLVSARLEHGDRAAYFAEAAARSHVMPPDGRIVRLSPRTIEAWFYLYKRGGFDALLPDTRADKGTSRAIPADVADLVVRAKREKPRRSIRRIIRMLERAGVVERGELAKATVHRLLAAQQISARPVRGASAERRSFLAEHVGDLVVGDALHPRAPVIAPDGKLRKVILFSQLDNATRAILHSYFAVVDGESAAAQEYGLKQVLLKYGLMRAYYVDRGPAYIAQSLRDICAELGIHLVHTGAGDAEAKGSIERWHRTWREEVEDELPDGPISLADLSAKHWAWIGAEYHARAHETTGRAPREHLLAEAGEFRALPRDKNLDDVFLHRETRKVRKDATVRWRGGYLEVRAELTRQSVELRFDPHDDSALPRVFTDGKFFCDTVPLDRIANVDRRRRRVAGEPEPLAKPSGLDPLGLIEDEHYRRTRLVTPAYDDNDDDDDDDDDQET
jgi:transposase InsO family protein